MLVLISDVDALYDAPPSQPGAKAIHLVNAMSDIESVVVGGAGKAGVGSGGMVTKIEAARISTGAGIPMLLTSLEKAEQALSGAEVGTLFAAHGVRTNSRLLWLAHASTPQGRLILDAGAEYDATWNVDKVDGHEKAFCCFNAVARDYARVGLALMSGSPKIASTSWKARLSNPVVNLDYGWGYAAQMWHPYPGINLMMGLHGQYIYQDALHDTVIVKLSDMPTSADGISDKIAAVLREISEKKS